MVTYFVQIQSYFSTKKTLLRGRILNFLKFFFFSYVIISFISSVLAMCNCPLRNYGMDVLLVSTVFRLNLWSVPWSSKSCCLAQCFIQTPKLWGGNYDCWGVDDRAPKARGRVAVGDETETPKASRGWGMGTGYPLPNRLKDLGERRELPQWGPGRSPGRKRIWCTLELSESHWWQSFWVF